MKMAGLEFYFQVCLRSLIVKNIEDDELIKAYDLTQPDETVRRNLRMRVRTAMASPRGTGDYQGKTELGFVSESIALQSVELNGLTALVFLGEREVIPKLLKLLREDKTKNIKRRIVAGMALRYLTGQDIGSETLQAKDLDLWEEWWEQNKSSFTDK